MIKKISDDSVKSALKIKEKYLKPIQAASSVNAFQWCRASLSLEHPEAFEVVQRFEADSKFFRSLLVVLFILITLAIFQKQPWLAIIIILLMAIAFWRYVDQRVKATNQAYWYVITLEANKALPQTELPNHPDSVTHAGGVVFRNSRKGIVYLILKATKTDEWVLPKGHIESGEGMVETAVREVQEETGVWARIINELDTLSFTANNEAIKVKFYLMEYAGKQKTNEKRHYEWQSFPDARRSLAYADSKTLLAFAEEQRRKMKSREEKFRKQA